MIITVINGVAVSKDFNSCKQELPRDIYTVGFFSLLRKHRWLIFVVKIFDR